MVAIISGLIIILTHATKKDMLTEATTKNKTSSLLSLRRMGIFLSLSKEYNF